MIRIGVIGAGGNGSGHCRAFSANHSARCKVTAIADVNQEAAGKLAQQYGAKAVGTAEDLFGEVDAVIISSPNFLHCEHAVAAARAGKHVWVEKPMALSVAEADRIVAAVSEARVRSFVGFSVRFGSVPRTLAKVYRDGALGDLVSIWSRRMSGRSVEASRDRGKSWRGAYATSGGVISELIAHEIDWMVDIAGMPQTVYCRTMSVQKDDPRANDHVWLTFTFAGGKTGSIEGSQVSPVPVYDKGIVGTKAGAHDRSWGREAWLCASNKDATQLTPEPDFDKHGHFLDVIEGKCESVADVAWGRTVVAITDRALAGATGGGVERVG